MSTKPILPKIGLIDTRSYQVDRGYRIKGVEFRVYLGVLDNDTLDTSGVASRLGWASILPRDESRLFRNFSEGKNLADLEAVRLAQKTIVNNAQHRAYRDRADKEIQELRDSNMELKNANNQLSGLPGVVRDLEERLSKALQELSLAKGDLIVEIARSSKFRDDLQQKQRELDTMQSKFNSLTDRNQQLE